MRTINQNSMVIWYQPEGPGTAWKPLGVGISGASGRTVPRTNRTLVYGTDRYGRPVPIGRIDEAPNGQPGMTLTVFDQAKVSAFEKLANQGCSINVQIRVVLCGALDHPNLWSVVDHHGGGIITQQTLPDGPSAPYNGANAVQQATLVFDDTFRLVRMSLSRLNLVTTTDVNDIAVVTDVRCGGDCDDGYPGADKLMYLAKDAAAGVPALVAFSRNGGGSFAEIAGSDAFGNDEHDGHIVWSWADEGTIRVIVSCITTAAGAKAKIKWADLEIGNEENGTFTAVLATHADIVNGDVVTAMHWPDFNRLYIATTGGVITINDAQGEIWDQDPAADAGVEITCFASSYDSETVYAAGASNAILRETEQEGTFVARVGPNGGGAFTALAVAADGTLYAGNGNGFYKSINGAANEGGWELKRDFGTNMVVREIMLVGVDRSLGGDSEILRVVVDDTSGGIGYLYESLDGGASWRRVSTLANSGYNAGVHSRSDNNKLWIAGNDHSATSLVHVASGK